MEQPGELTCGGPRGDHVVEQGHVTVMVGRYLEGAAQVPPALARPDQYGRTQPTFELRGSGILGTQQVRGDGSFQELFLPAHLFDKPL